MITLELDCRVSFKNALNMFIVVAMTYSLQKYVRLCELVKALLILQLCQGLHFYPYDLTRTIPPLQGAFLSCARPTAEPSVLDVLSQEIAAYVTLY